MLPDDVNSIKESIILLKGNFVSEKNVLNRIKYLHNDFIKTYLKIDEKDNEEEYLLFTKEELDKLLNDCTEYIYDKLRELGDND